LHGVILRLVLELGRAALILGAVTGIVGAILRVFGAEAGAQPVMFALTGLVVVPYAIAALLSSANPRLWRWRARVAWLGGGLSLILGGWLVPVAGAPWAMLATAPVALAVTLMVERLR